MNPSGTLSRSLTRFETCASYRSRVLTVAGVLALAMFSFFVHVVQVHKTQRAEHYRAMRVGALPAKPTAMQPPPAVITAMAPVTAPMVADDALVSSMSAPPAVEAPRDMARPVSRDAPRAASRRGEVETFVPPPR